MRKKTAQSATQEFIDALNIYLKNCRIPKWKLATLYDIHPSDLSRVLAGNPVWVTVAGKVQKIADKIGFSGQIFKPLGDANNDITPSVWGNDSKS